MSSPASGNQFNWKYPATLENVERVCLAARQVLDESSLHKKDRFALELLLREALNNAVIHGCDHNPSLSFSCQLELTDRQVIIEVADDGPGFDWRRRPEAPPDNLAESGRGLSIYALYTNLIKFNPAGNCVTLTRIFNPGENHD
jgi:serine/threonine-protein kinase RsbW